MNPRCYQVNLQAGWGGGEVYACFFTRALLANGIPTTLVVHPDNHRWHRWLPEDCPVLPVRNMEELAAQLPGGEPAWLLFHTPARKAEAEPLQLAGHYMSAIAHMPLYGRDPSYLRHYDLVYGVSRHVLDSLRVAGIEHIYPEPLLGIADLPGRAGAGTIIAASPYEWDQRKGRDRLLSWLHPLYARCLPERSFARAPGITLGLVSRLTPIKQFPLLFRHLAPVLAKHENFRLDIFGAGGYASVRDLKQTLAPIAGRVRFWGHQTNVAAVYRQLDYLMTGLPEREALGLNVIEAQSCGTPVLAVRAPPFTETVAEGITGLFYEDPRNDGGADFDRLLHRLAATPFRIDAARAPDHLNRFSEAAFTRRVARLIEATVAKPALMPNAA